MRIISKFHDFYDRAIGFGIDPKLIFMRDPSETIPAPKSVPHLCFECKGWHLLFRSFIGTVSTGYLSFCGNIHPFVRMPADAYGDPPLTFFDFDDFINHCATEKRIHRSDRKEIVLALSNLPSSDMAQRRYERRKDSWARRGGKREWNSFWAEHQKMDVAVHLALCSPIFAFEDFGREARLSINPKLQDFGFGKIHDAFTCFQMIAQYLGNDMASTMDPDPKISDVLKAHSAGFDKWSFRKHRDDP